MIDVDPEKVSAWIGLGKTGLGLLQAAWRKLPKGKETDEIERTLAEAEKALAESNARLAHELGYKLCQCTFPPLPMLWVEAENSYVCQNPKCGHRIERPKATRISPASNSWGRSRGR